MLTPSPPQKQQHKKTQTQKTTRRLLTDSDATLRERLLQVLFSGNGNQLQWARLTNLIELAKQGGAGGRPGLDLSDTVRDAARLLLLDDALRRRLLLALTEGNRLHVDEVAGVLALLGADVSPGAVARGVARDLPSIGRAVLLGWADKVLVS
jgi:hypothetical protein